MSGWRKTGTHGRHLAAFGSTGMAWLVATSLAAPAAAGPVDFGAGPCLALTPEGQAWHRELEANSSYGESWFFLVQLANQGVLFASSYITNLGLRTFDSGYAVTYYAPDGEIYPLAREHPRAAIRAATLGTDVTIAESRIHATGSSLHYTLNEPDYRVNLTLDPLVPAPELGNCHVVYGDHGTWDIGMEIPRGTAHGTLTVKGQVTALDGVGYFDHTWTTAKTPAAVSSMITLRAYSPKYTVVLIAKNLRPDLSSAPLTYGVLGIDNRVATPLRHFTYAAVRTRRDRRCNCDVPVELAIKASANGYRVMGSVKESRFLETIDVLGRLSFPVRAVVRAFYANPWTLRLMGHYELEITDPAGTTEKISGEAPIEVHHY